MSREVLLTVAKTELERHEWSHYIDEPPTMSVGGKSAVVPGCVACRKRLNTSREYLRHLSEDVLPKILAMLEQSEEQKP